LCFDSTYVRKSTGTTFTPTVHAHKGYGHILPSIVHVVLHTHRRTVAPLASSRRCSRLERATVQLESWVRAGDTRHLQPREVLNTRSLSLRPLLPVDERGRRNARGLRHTERCPLRSPALGFRDKDAWAALGGGVRGWWSCCSVRRRLLPVDSFGRTRSGRRPLSCVIIEHARVLCSPCWRC